MLLGEKNWESLDKAAALQLGLTDDYSIFMMSAQIDYIDDAVVALENEDRCEMCGMDAIGTIETNVVRVMLPKGMALVGMSKFGIESEPKWGVITLPQ